jgi:hypothetical protein
MTLLLLGFKFGFDDGCLELEIFLFVLGWKLVNLNLGFTNGLSKFRLLLLLSLLVLSQLRSDLLIRDAEVVS